MNNTAVINTTRPAVSRQYFGENIANTNLEYTYPKSVSAGMVMLETDPMNYATRPMSSHMLDI